MPSRDFSFLFPRPSRDVKNPLAPRFWPGRSTETSHAVARILKDNRDRWEGFIYRIYHNHVSHTVLAHWAMGANERIIEAAYDRPQEHLAPAAPPALHITRDNWMDHLGDHENYTAYLVFFEAEVMAKGIDQVFKEYIFSPEANLGTGKGSAPEMVNRLVDGIFHPMIYVGNGLEFNMPGILAEGLAQTAVHDASSSVLFPLSAFENLATATTSLENSGAGLHAFTILGRVIRDPELSVEGGDVMQAFGHVMVQFGRKLRGLVDQWDLPTGNIGQAVEELSWTAAILYGVAGSASETKFIADFFFMHLVTSAIFLPTLIAHIEKPAYQRIFLRGYFASMLVWYVARGRPRLDLKGFFSNPSTAQPVAPGAHPTPALSSARGVLEADAITPNSWLPIIQSSLAHPDEHTPKLQRALAHFGELYGEAEKGRFRATELEGAEEIDGSLFLRVAGLSMIRNHWVREGEEVPQDSGFRPVGVWDFQGIGQQI